MAQANRWLVSNLTDLASARISLSKANFDQGLLWELSCKDERAMKDLLLDNDLSFFPSASFAISPSSPAFFVEGAPETCT